MYKFVIIRHVHMSNVDLWQLKSMRSTGSFPASVRWFPKHVIGASISFPKFYKGTVILLIPPTKRTY